ncbi:hypothetical protein AAGG49_22725, partial [Stenotrophomonas maltophilia]|uniref:hypothetical protein n=1 Tax=Stenotrophomonas maltophilia TaxID=40324 RepID=UPI00313E4265
FLSWAGVVGIIYLFCVVVAGGFFVAVCGFGVLLVNVFGGVALGLRLNCTGIAFGRGGPGVLDLLALLLVVLAA